MTTSGYVSPEQLARYFHDQYERLAPSYGYRTRTESAVPWEDVPINNRQLMISVAGVVLLEFFPDRMTVRHGPDQ